MREFTVVYTDNMGRATLTFYKNITVNENETFEEALYINGISICQLWMVFPGKHEAIMSDWTKL